MKTRLTLRVLCLMILLTGCDVLKTTVPTGNIVLHPNTETSALLTPSDKLSQTPTTELATSHLTSSSTPFTARYPRQTITLTPVPSWTPLPTLNPEEAIKMVIKLLENNAGCQLPCWWGITPGETSWQQAQNILAEFSQISIRCKTDNYCRADVLIPLPKAAGTIWHYYTIEDEKVNGIDVFNWNYASFLGLSNLLTNYGPPDEIWMGAYPDPDQGLKPSLTLFYERGFAVVIYDGGVTETEEKFTFCTQGDWPYLHMWTPDRELTFQEAAKKWFYKPEEWRFLTLEEATGLSIEEFYQIATNPENETCLDTARNLWP